MTNRKPLTKASIDALAPRAKPWIAWDGGTRGCRGFGVKIAPSGLRTFIVQYRVWGRGNAKRLKIGRVEDVRLDDARKLAWKVVQDADDGVDAMAERNAKRDALTVAQACERYRLESVRIHRKPRTAREYERHLDKVIIPALGDRKFADLDRARVKRFHATMKDTPCKANRVLATLSAMYTWGHDAGLVPKDLNPAARIDKFAENERVCELSDDEWDRLVDALDRAENELGVMPSAVLAIRLYLLTGARRDEIRTARWEWIDWSVPAIKLPDSKTGARSIYLNEDAVALLQAADRGSNPFIIAGANRDKPLSYPQASWAKIRRMAELDRIRLHDLRHIFASRLANAGVSLYIIGDLLGHSRPETTQRYAHLTNEARARATALVKVSK